MTFWVTQALNGISFGMLLFLLALYFVQLTFENEAYQLPAPGPTFAGRDVMAPAAAHLSVADYLGGLDWRGHKQTTDWYAVMKSRPSFRPLLTERMEVIQPPAHYDKPDF